MHLRPADANDASAISRLVQASFIEHIAPDWEPSAQRNFLAETEARKLEARISEAAACLVCEHGGDVLGVILLPRPTLVQLLFVAPGHLRRGIGRILWSAARTMLEEKHPEVATVELNSSPCAVAAYKALGFFPISKPFKRRGAIATRMACWLPGKPLEQAEHVARTASARSFAEPVIVHTFDPAAFAQRQLDAYNARDLERFVREYAEEVVIYRMPDPNPVIVGRAALAAHYRSAPGCCLPRVLQSDLPLRAGDRWLFGRHAGVRDRDRWRARQRSRSHQME